jgi:hypothetical protein
MNYTDEISKVISWRLLAEIGCIDGVLNVNESTIAQVNAMIFERRIHIGPGLKFIHSMYTQASFDHAFNQAMDRARVISEQA